jgi:hypothetical protein
MINPGAGRHRQGDRRIGRAKRDPMSNVLSVSSERCHDLSRTAAAACPDIMLVMQTLRHASQENHLPAFERGADKV